MIISAILREHNRRKDLEEHRKDMEGSRKKGLQEGRLEMQTLWEAWNQRRMEARERGEEFDEMPPGIADRNGLDGQNAE